MRYASVILFILIITLSACASNSTLTSDTLSIQNTAVAMAWTTVSKTQIAGLPATVNAQGTQLAILTQPTVTIPPPTPNLLMIEDNGIKVALLAVLGGNESGFTYGQDYNDGQLAIGYYHRRMSSDDGSWFAQRDSGGLWGIFYISHGIPPCKELQKFNLNKTVPVICLDLNGNQIMLWEWHGQ